MASEYFTASPEKEEMERSDVKSEENLVTLGDSSCTIGALPFNLNPISQVIAGPVLVEPYMSTLSWEYQRPGEPFHDWEHTNVRKKILPQSNSDSILSGRTFLSNVEKVRGCQDSTNTKTTCKQKEKEDSMRTGMSPLDSFIEHLSSTKARFPDSENCTLIKNEVENLVFQLCSLLSTEFKMFKNYQILKTGSVYEGVKIGSPDEFDFMIELPELVSALELRQSLTSVSPHIVEFSIVKKEFFDDIIEAASSKVETSSKENEEQVLKDYHENEALFQSVLLSISDIIENRIKTLIVGPKWEWVCMNSSTGGVLPRIAFSPVLIWKGSEFNNLFVSFDICLALPLQKDLIWQLGSKPFVDAWHGHGQLNDIVLDHASKNIQHVLIRDYKSCRTSFSLQEQKIMKQFSLNDGQNKCFRVLKYLRDRCISKSFSHESQDLYPKLSTYLLKTVMYYHFERFPHSSDWCQNKLGDRILEIFRILLQSIQHRKLYSYFIPGYNMLNFKQSLDDTAFELQQMLLLLEKLHDGDMDALRQIEINIQRREKEDKKLVDVKRKEMLLDFLYVYAFNGYDDDLGLETIQRFIQMYFSGKMEIIGSGRSIVLMENGARVNVDKELEEMYHEPFSYYKA